MRGISDKSTGQLVDELVTNAFKTTFAVQAGKAGNEFEERYGLLREALAERLGADLASVVNDLCVISLATWCAQEVVMQEADDGVAAVAARHAQRLNARRTFFIREIDRLLGESHITITTKTYG